MHIRSSEYSAIASRGYNTIHAALHTDLAAFAGGGAEFDAARPEQIWQHQILLPHLYIEPRH